MPVAVSVLEPTRFVVDVTGNVTGAEVFQGIDTILSDPNFSRGTTVLVVARGVTGTPGSHELRDLAAAVVALKDAGMPGLAIVTEPGFVYGVARMFSSLAELVGVPVEVFQDPAEARNRLDEISARPA